jgi:TPR repeat protein
VVDDPNSFSKWPESEESILPKDSKKVHLEDIQEDIDEITRLWLEGKSSDDYFKAVSKERIAVWRQAAEECLAEGQLLLGACYHRGLGVPKNFTEAVKWYRKAAEQGNPCAQHDLGIYYQSVRKNYTEAVKWHRKAAEQGVSPSQNNLGVCYQKGWGVTQDCTEAMGWYRKAAAQGCPSGENNLGLCYENGWGVPQDFTEALMWYRKAAERGNSNSQNALGWCYAHGKGVPQDYSEAAKWYRKAAKQGNGSAYVSLGACHVSALFSALFNRSECYHDRRPFQFSIAKMLLWTTVWAVYLNILRLADIGLPASLFLTICLAVILAARIIWGAKRCMQIAAGTASFCLGGATGFQALVEFIKVPSVRTLTYLIGTPLLWFCIGAFLMIGSFTVVQVVIRTVDWIDSLMRSKTPPEK